jgi:hypothetical protein
VPRGSSGCGAASLGDGVLIADHGLRNAARVVEPHEQLGDDQHALGESRALVRKRDGRLERGDEVVAEVADDGLPELLGLREGHEARATADE